MMVPLALILQAVALPAPVEERPVRVWLGPSPVTRGEVMPVYVAAASAGYLLVLRARSDGKVEIVFPADPRSDGAIKRGAYELRGVGGKPAVVVNEPNGTGLMLAALSPTPFRFDEFLRGGAWHGGALIASWPGADGVGTLTDIVQRMLGDGWFNYDMAIYTVGQRRERRPLVAATPVASAAPAPADVSVCTDCTIVYQSAPPEPVVVETFVERTFSEPLVLLPRQRRPHHRRDAPKVKTEGICSIGIDCPEGIGQGKAISMRRPSLVMTRNYRPRAPVASPLAGGTVVTSNVIVAPPPPPPPNRVRNAAADTGADADQPATAIRNRSRCSRGVAAIAPTRHDTGSRGVSHVGIATSGPGRERTRYQGGAPPSLAVPAGALSLTAALAVCGERPGMLRTPGFRPGSEEPTA